MTREQELDRIDGWNCVVNFWASTQMIVTIGWLEDECRLLRRFIEMGEQVDFDKGRLDACMAYVLTSRQPSRILRVEGNYGGVIGRLLQRFVDDRQPQGASLGGGVW